MRSAEAELHLLQVNVSASELSINALVETLDRLEGELFASLLDVVQQRHLEAVRSGEAPPVRCPRCGGRRWVKRESRPRQLKTGRVERIGYAEPSTLRTTAHAERAMRELNRRTRGSDQDPNRNASGRGRPGPKRPVALVRSGVRPHGPGLVA